MCAFTRYGPASPGHFNLLINSTVSITSLTIVHVGDLFFVGVDSDLIDFKKCLSSFKRGDFEALKVSNPLIFCGISINLHANRIVEMNRNLFASTLGPMNKDELLPHGRLRHREELNRSACKKFIGGLLWLLQTRYDLAFLASLVSSMMIESIGDAQKMEQMINQSVKICKIARIQDRGLFPTHLPSIIKSEIILCN